MSLTVEMQGAKIIQLWEATDHHRRSGDRRLGACPASLHFPCASAYAVVTWKG